MAAVDGVSRPRFLPCDFEPATIGRFCDVIMKGGVTSGIVYPLTICRLATQFMLKNIGGTSVGAIAAVLAAAAEYRRREHLDSPAEAVKGFEALSGLPEFLGQKNMLLSLFAADARSRPFLRIALSFVGNGTWYVKALKAALVLAVNLWFVVLPVIAVAAALLVGYGAFAAQNWLVIVTSFVSAVLAGLGLAAVVALVWCIATLSGNAFGWCHAHDEAKLAAFQRWYQRADGDLAKLTTKHTPPLFDWLHAFIQFTAGLPDDQPLTFGNLWGSKRPDWSPDRGDPHAINFKVVTTCVTFGRPFALPFEQRESGDASLHAFYFTVKDFSAYFPDAVVKSMTSAPSSRPVVTVAGTTYHPLPDSTHLPVVVATRMSMSFPILFCAIRLYEMVPAVPGSPSAMRPVWFSDGGLSSNFPISFFDAPLARWPTLAIDLLDQGHPIQDGTVCAEDVLLESSVPQAELESWDTIQAAGWIAPLLGFCSAIVDTMRTWQDSTLGTFPKNRSRTVGIRLPSDEGGINLMMTQPQVEDLIARGDAAGESLLAQFGDGQNPAGWLEHRGIRFRTTMGALTRWFDELDASSADVSDQETYRDMIQRCLQDPAQCEAAFSALIDFFRKAHPQAGDVFRQGEPIPKGEFVLRTRL